MPWVPPDAAAVLIYLEGEDGGSSSEPSETLQAALAAEMAAQLRVIRLPAQVDLTVDEPYPADLAEALCRRVAHNLAVRALPLGIQASITDSAVSTNFVGGTDAEVRRLERPYRRLVVG